MVHACKSRERLLHCNLAFHVRCARGAEGTRELVADAHPRPVVLCATPRHDRAYSAMELKGLHEMLACSKPLVIFRAGPVHAGRGDPREMQQVTWFDALHQ